MKQCITVDEQIALLKNHGVSFDLMSEAEAREFLYSRSYFFKIKSYERNYTRIEKDRSYTYSGLDFGHLVELSYIDFTLSRICLSLALSTEHFLKVRLNQLIMNDPKPDLSEVLVRRILNGDTSSIRSNPYTEDMWVACDGNPFTSITEERALPSLTCYSSYVSSETLFPMATARSPMSHVLRNSVVNLGGRNTTRR